MSKVTITVLNNTRDDAIKNYQLFEWKLIEEKKDLKETTLTFERDENTPYYPELVALEEKFHKVYTFPSWLSYVLIAITLIYVSVIAILWISHVIDVKKEILVIILAIPTGVLLLINTGLSFLRSRQMNHHILHKEEKYQEYAKKIEEIKKK
ncbi:MAG: hypothetical protein K6C32_01975 [Bacilli bacterium]|nr:hypothetical protein [Bacilli bacterium]